MTCEPICFERITTGNPDFVAAVRRHYTGSRGAPPGKKLAWEIYEDGRRIGWIGLSDPAARLAPRRCLGLADIRPLPHTVSNFIYRLEEPHRVPASEILKLWLPFAADEWERRYPAGAYADGGRPIHWETMVGQGDATNLGACFKAAGFRSLGWTTGRGAVRPPGATHGPRVWVDKSPKLVLYRGPLARVAPRVAPRTVGWRGRR